jgi:hypothetical protein
MTRSRVKQDKLRNIQPMEPASPDEELEKVRLRFHERLRGEQLVLAGLTKMLGSTSGESSEIFRDIREFAHRLRGAALVFEFEKLGAAAKAVELAAIAAILDETSRRKDTFVASTMQALTMTLAQSARCIP